ncbi:MAG: mandelate racemase/muconate lactonizing enzyme family protein [Pseudomonadota bacterium]
MLTIVRVETFLMRAGGPTETAWSASGLSGAGTRHWCFVRITAEDGTRGIGEGSGWPRLVHAACEELAPLLVGEDATGIERLWQKMHLAQMGHGMTGTPGGGALSALETALWDLNARALGVPLWRLLGGKLRDVVPAYAHTSGVETARRLIGLGYRTFKTGGVATAQDKAAALRAEFGSDIDLCVDLHGPPWLTPGDARRALRRMEDLDLLFAEEPVAPELAPAMADLRREGVPLAAGERVAKLWDGARLVTEGYVDVVQPDTGRFGGLSQMRKLAAVAEAHGVTVAPHAGTLGPVAEFAALHLMATLPNALILERFGEDWPGRAKVVTASPELRDGGLVVPDAPGLGVDLVDEEIARHAPGPGIRVPAHSDHCAPGTANEFPYIQARRAAGAPR